MAYRLVWMALAVYRLAWLESPVVPVAVTGMLMHHILGSMPDRV